MYLTDSLTSKPKRPAQPNNTDNIPYQLNISSTKPQGWYRCHQKHLSLLNSGFALNVLRSISTFFRAEMYFLDTCYYLSNFTERT